MAAVACKAVAVAPAAIAPKKARLYIVSSMLCFRTGRSGPGPRNVLGLHLQLIGDKTAALLAISTRGVFKPRKRKRCRLQAAVVTVARPVDLFHMTHDFALETPLTAMAQDWREQPATPRYQPN